MELFRRSGQTLLKFLPRESETEKAVGTTVAMIILSRRLRLKSSLPATKTSSRTSKSLKKKRLSRTPRTKS